MPTNIEKRLPVANARYSSRPVPVAKSSSNRLQCNDCDLGFKVALEEINKDKAEQLLSIPTPQRRLRSNRIAQYARLMSEGLWEQMSTIKLDVNGGVGDGQNRLHAVIQSDTTQHFIVFRDVHVKEFLATDTGETRTRADAIRLVKGIKSVQSSVYGNALNFLARWKSGSKRPFGPDTDRFTLVELTQVGGEFPEIEEAMNLAQQIDHKIYGRWDVWTALLARFLSTDPVRAREFATRMADGDGLHADHPILLCRRTLTKDSHKAAKDKKRLNPERIARLVIKTWNAYKQGESPSSFRNTGSFPIPEE